LLSRKPWTTTIFFHDLILFNTKDMQRTTLSIYWSRHFCIELHLVKQNTQLLAYLEHSAISSYQAINMHSRTYEFSLSHRSYSHRVANVLTSLGVPVNISDFQTWWEVPARFLNWDFRYSQLRMAGRLCWDVTYILMHISVTNIQGKLSSFQKTAGLNTLIVGSLKYIYLA